MPLIRGKVVLILGFVFLTTFLAAVRGLPVRKQRGNSPKERSSKLAEVRQPLGKDGNPRGCWGEPSSASAPSPCPGRLRSTASSHQGSLGGGRASPKRAASNTCLRGQAAPGGKAAAVGRSRVSCLPSLGGFLTR